MRKTSTGATLRHHHLGPHPLIRHYLERMNFPEIIRGCIGTGVAQSLDHAEVLAVLVHNVLVSRGPMYRIQDWAQRIEPNALNLTAAQMPGLNDDRLVRSLEALASERGRNVFFRLALRVIKDFELHLGRIHFDTTTVTLFGAYAASRTEPRITQGHNKDHRPDLKQLVFGLNVAADGAVPLLHHIFSGNRTDDSVHIRNVNQLRPLLQRDDFIYVADSKLCTRANLSHVDGYGGQFVTVMPRSRKEDKQFRTQLRAATPAVRWRKFHEIPNHRQQTGPPTVYSSTSAGPQQTAEGYRLIWVRSSQKATLDHESRLDRVRKAELALKAIGARIGKPSLRTRSEIKARTAKILAKYHVTAFLETSITTFNEVEYRYLRPGRPKPGDPMRKIQRRKLQLVITKNSAALRAEARVDGVFPLITNLNDRSKREILEIYKYQPYIEKRFALTKSEYGVAPVFLKKPTRVVGLLHVYFIAIMLSALIERQVRSAMKKRNIKKIAILPEGRLTPTPTTPRILENFADVAWDEYQEDDRVVTFPVSINKTQALLLQLAEVPVNLYH